jgi:hypothetical protein
MIVIPMSLNAAPAKGLGMWVWSESDFSTDEARQKLLAFCLNHHINHLDIHISISGDESEPVLQGVDALRSLVQLAGLNNITVAALRGSPKMFFSQNHRQTLHELQAIIAFYRSLPAGSLFRGIKYDVEPYRTREWKAKGEDQRKVALDYLAFLTKARSVLAKDAPGLWLAVDMPFWWDKDELRIEFQGSTKRLSEHVQDLTDFVVVMSYRRNVEKVMECVENERRYAKQLNKVIFPSLETVELKEDQHVSFWESPSQVFWEVVPQLLELAEDDPAIGGLMLHCYHSLAQKFNNRLLDKVRKRMPKE